jgi:Copper type II ascorbate-dependent monooxygenase, C-terminal domain
MDIRGSNRVAAVWSSAWFALAGCTNDAPAPPLPALTPIASGAAGSGAAGNAGSASAGGAGGAAVPEPTPEPTNASGSAGAPAAGAPAAGAPAAGAPAVDGPFPTSPLRAEIVARAVAPGDEQHVCVVIPLDNAVPVWVNAMRAELFGGSHHLIVDRPDPATKPQLEATVCSVTAGSDATRLMIAQQRETKVTLPSGVAFPLAVHQPLFLQLHYINLNDAPMDIRGSLELFLSDREAAPPIEAKSRFTGATTIMIPAKSPATVQSFVKPPIVQGRTARVFALTSHTHRLGVHASIERVLDLAAPAATPLHVSTDWAEPPLTMLDPPLAFDGSDGLRLTCQYQNDTDEEVTFGILAEQEMCFMWLYYYDE